MAALPAAGPVNQAADVGSEWGRRHIWLTWMTCAADRLEHAVTDEDFAAGLILQGQMYGRASLTCDDASPVFPATRHFSSI